MLIKRVVVVTPGTLTRTRRLSSLNNNSNSSGSASHPKASSSPQPLKPLNPLISKTLNSPVYTWLGRVTVAACVATIGFVGYNSYSSASGGIGKGIKDNGNLPTPVKSMRPLPPVLKMLSMEEVDRIFKKNQKTLHPSEEKAETTMSRVDLNSVPSNLPCEDYHAQHEFKHGVLLGIYDGHGGSACADVLSKTLCSYVAKEIEKVGGAEKAAKQEVISAMQKAFLEMDHDIVNGCLDIVQPKQRWYDLLYKPAEYPTVLKGLKIAGSGACAIVTYIQGDKVFVASAGDCRAVLGRQVDYAEKGQPTNSKMFQAIDLSQDHTATSPTEFSRMCEEHPGEDATIVIRGRVLGGLQPSRAFGDARYKWSRPIQEAVTPHLGRRIPPNLLTPPYVTAKPDVTFYQRDKNDKFIVMACDGLWDEIESGEAVDIVRNFMDKGFIGNYATGLMISALSGNGTQPERVIHNLSIPIDTKQSRKYRDDMTVNVIFFPGTEVEPKPAESILLSTVPPYRATFPPSIYHWVGMTKNSGQSKAKL